MNCRDVQHHVSRSAQTCFSHSPVSSIRSVSRQPGHDHVTAKKTSVSPPDITSRLLQRCSPEFSCLDSDAFAVLHTTASAILNVKPLDQSHQRYNQELANCSQSHSASRCTVQPMVSAACSLNAPLIGRLGTWLRPFPCSL